MANIKSAKKRILVAEKNNLRNRMVKSALKTQLKRYNAAVVAGETEAVSALLPVVSGSVDKAAKKGVIHKNAANRKKAQLAVMASKLS